MIKTDIQPAHWPWQKEIFLQLQLAPWIMLRDDLSTAKALSEAMALLPEFVAHRPESQAGRGKWKGLSLKSAGGISGETNFVSGEYSLTEIARHCPATLSLLDSLTDISQCERIRFMLLEPGGEIVVHSDAPDKPTSLALNIALNMPEGCEFWVDLDPDGGLNPYAKKIPIRPGCAFLFNSSTYHRVVNHSAEMRMHLIAHGPLRLRDEELIKKARAQNHTRDIRHVTNLLLRKKLEKGEVVEESDPIYCDYLNFGALYDFLPPTIRIALLTEALPDPALARESLLVTAAGLNNIPHEIVPRENLSQWLSRQADSGGKQALLIAAGTQIHEPTLFVTEIVKEVTRMSKSGAAISAHLLQRSGDLPYMHEQFLLLDLNAWGKAGRPDFEDGGNISFPAHERAQENVHDDHTPIWLKASEGEKQAGKARFGTHVLAALLSHGMPALNVSSSLRAQKDYMYPREGRGHDYARVRARIDRYLEEKSSRVYVFNTETLPIEDFPFQPNLLISPCAGFKPFSLMKQFGMHAANSRFLFLEKNRNALDYFRQLLECDTLPAVQALQEATLSQQGLLPVGGSAYVKKMTSAMLQELFGGSGAEFLACLKEMRANCHFEQIDYLNEPEKIASLLRPEDRVLFWHSNVWEYTAAFYERSAGELRVNYLSLVSRLSERFHLPALVHEESYKAVLGEDFLSPRIVLTAGGSRTGKPTQKSFRPLAQLQPGLK